MTLAEYIERLGEQRDEFAVGMVQKHKLHPELWPLDHTEHERDRMFALFLGVELEGR